MRLPSSQTTDTLNAAFAALADPTRRAILARLAQGETSVGDLVKPFAISAPAISRHLRVLESARLIERKVNAQWRICRLHPPGLRVASDWLAPYRKFWEQSLDRLVEVLERGEDQPASATSRASAPAARRPRGTRRPGTPRHRPTNQPRKKP